MGAMDDTDVPQAAIGDVPMTFDEAVVLLDVREDDEWQRGHAPGAQHPGAELLPPPLPPHLQPSPRTLRNDARP